MNWGSKKYGWLALIVVFGLGLVLGRHNTRPDSNQVPMRAENARDKLQSSSSPSDLVSSASELAFANGVKVVRVIDGDTIEIEGGERVRYIGMDTPEVADFRQPVQCFGAEAARRNTDLVASQTVRLEKDISERDRYQRLLRYVWLGGEMVNLRLVAEGYARVATFPPDVKYQKDFAEAEQGARANQLGLWGSCPAAAVAATTTTTSAPAANCQIKGNINASGEKIYHRPDCPYYTRTKIEATRGERWFCSDTEAVAAGWRVAANCP
ncbi:MAG: thermonuclease family protein [Candidatus Liptonbacteria bacterium]|nr:thermonuclease family protein [Candidatus Liptonbacteria bacterium]